MKPVPKWDVKDVEVWLKEKGFDEYVELFCKKHKIDGQSLLELTESNLASPPLSLSVLGDIKRIQKCIRLLRCNSSMKKKIQNKRSSETDNLSTENTSDEELAKIVTSGRDVYTSGYEVKRCILSFIYLFIACYTTSVVIVIVHNRVPDMKKYPPLPDLILENLPLIPWAFKASEYIIILHFIAWFIILIFHRHRFIILKRYCSIFGSVFFMRCFTLLFTSLSVPGTHHQCFAQMYKGVKATFLRSLEIMGYAGLSVNGVKSCGDYMFSGHTVVQTLMTLFISEYAPQRYSFLRLSSRILASFGMFFILAAHEHYTLDVICAFYISFRTFTNYHVLITARRISKHVAKSWNPIFYYMEKPLEQAYVPNEYESPITALRRWYKLVRGKPHAE